jgi:hypothetical protein
MHIKEIRPHHQKSMRPVVCLKQSQTLYSELWSQPRVLFRQCLTTAFEVIMDHAHAICPGYLGIINLRPCFCPS